MSDRSPPPIEFFFGFRSPYRYLAQTRLPGQGEAEAFEPMDLLPVVKTMGNSPITILGEAEEICGWSGTVLSSAY